LIITGLNTFKRNVVQNAQGGRYDNALQAASVYGNETVRLLLDARADVNAQGGDYGNALQAASAGGHEKVVQMLLDARANVDAQGGRHGNALQAASADGDEMVVQMLLGPGCAGEDVGSSLGLIA
jgi:ankyrin repeat protein